MQQLLKKLFPKVYLVGGAVRDQLIGLTPKDFDYVVEGLSLEEVARVLSPHGEADLVGASFGVIKFNYNGEVYDIAVPRQDFSTGSGHRDFKVKTEGVSLLSDLSRRDFRMNAMAVDLNSGALIDPYNGKEDIENRVVEVVSRDSFREDPLRMLRAIRFACRYDFRLGEDAALGLMREARRLYHIPVERYRKELEEIVMSPGVVRGLSILQDFGFFDYICPTLATMVDVPQPKEHHTLNVWEHTLKALENTTQGLVLRLAILFHDCGKPSCFLDTAGKITFHGHADKGAELARADLLRLGFGIDVANRIAMLVKCHMDLMGYDASEKALRRFVRRIGKENVSLMLRLMWADLKASKHFEVQQSDLFRLGERLYQCSQENIPTKTSELAINGNNVMAILGLKPGIVLGHVLRQLLDITTDNPELNTKEWLSEFLTTPCIL